MKSKLFIHIGSHKTGTTSIQNALFSNPEALAQQNVHYATAPGRPAVHPLLAWDRAADVATLGLHLRDPLEFLHEVINHPQDNVIISCENFSFFFQKDRIQELYDTVSPHFKEIKILCYLRRQDSHAISHQQEGSKPERLLETKIFGAALSALPKCEGSPFDTYLDYNARLSMWADVFGTDNIDIRVFEKDRLLGGDAWLDFCKAVSLDSSSFGEVSRQNESVGVTKLLSGLLLNQTGLDGPTKARVLKDLPDDAKFVPSRAEAQQFFERYKAGNMQLAQKFAIEGPEAVFDESFEMYPETARGIWAAANTQAVVRSLVRELSAPQSPGVAADKLRDEALRCEKSGDLKDALKFMKAARILRPSGPVIQLKIAEYKAALGEK